MPQKSTKKKHRDTSAIQEFTTGRESSSSSSDSHHKKRSHQSEQPPGQTIVIIRNKKDRDHSRDRNHNCNNSCCNPCCCPCPTGPTGPTGPGIFNSNTVCDGVDNFVLEPTTPAPDANLILISKGLGFYSRRIPDPVIIDDGVIGGLCRGQWAVDWQSSRTAVDQVARGKGSVISGGLANKIAGAVNVDSYSTISGGRFNLIAGTDNGIGSGTGNSIVDNSGANLLPSSNFIGSGGNNKISSELGDTVAEDHSGIVSGNNGRIQAGTSFIGAGSNNFIGPNPPATTHFAGSGIMSGSGNRISATASSIGSGSLNTIDAIGSFIGSGAFNSITVNGGRGVIGGGSANSIDAQAGMIGGGSNNSIQVLTSINSVIGGGDGNQIGSSSTTPVQSADHSFIGGGGNNVIEYNASLINGGLRNFIGPDPGFMPSSFISEYINVIGGGSDNIIHNLATDNTGEDSTANTIGGGFSNEIQGVRNVIGGGDSNAIVRDLSAIAPVLPSNATIGGGEANTINNDFGTIAGGKGNLVAGTDGTVSGGEGNTALFFATVGGGGGSSFSNTASGDISTIAGGGANTASGISSSIGGGAQNVTSGEASTAPGGVQLETPFAFSTAVCKANLPGLIGTANRVFMVGGGSVGPGPSYIVGSRTNLFSVTDDGNAHISGTLYTTLGADYAEFFQSTSSEKIPYGTSVTFDTEGFIRPTLVNEIPVGVISNKAALVANSAEEEWQGKFVRDVNGRVIIDNLEVEAEEPVREPFEKEVIKEVYDGIKVKQVKEKITGTQPVMIEVPLYDADGTEIGTRKMPKMQKVKKVVQQRRLNPNFDPMKTYVPRSERLEWNIVGLIGIVKIIKEQPVATNWVRIKEFDAVYDLYLIK